MERHREKRQQLTREQIFTLYQAGPEAIVSLVQYLQEEISNLSERVEALEREAKKTSRNSNKPPSSDGMRKPPAQTRKPTGRKPGGQKGHEGSTLKLVSDPDRVEIHRNTVCSHCGESLVNNPIVDYDCRQVFDIPVLAVQVTEHQGEIKRCEHCGEITNAVFPEAITHKTQYGSNLKAIALYLKNYCLLPYERCSELLEDLFGTPISVGTLVSITNEGGRRVEGVTGRIKKAITRSKVAHFDETGMRICGKLHWLHTAGTSELTYYQPHQKRGGAAMDEMGILPALEGTAVHDGWKSYFAYSCEHSLCNAHHLRELTCIHEDYRQQWAKEMINFLLEVKSKRENGTVTQFSESALREFQQRYGSIVQKGFEANPPPETDGPKHRGLQKKSKPLNLLERLRDYERYTLAFLYDFSIPFDNNQGERDLRMMKVQQKISGTFRSFDGASSFCSLRSYISTVKKQRLNVISALQDIFSGKTLLPHISMETAE